MNPKIKITLTAVCLVLATCLPIQAGDISVPAHPTDVAPLPSATAGALTLDIAAAYQLAVSRNLNLQVGRYDLAAANTGIITNSGIFDPGMELNVNGDFRQSPTTTQLDGALVNESRNTRFSLGFGQLVPTGGRWTLSAGLYRNETNSTWATINPSWSSDLSAQITQPLLDGFGTTVNRSGIIIAANTRDQTAVGYEIQVISTLLDVERAYWDYIYAREVVTVDEQSLELAQRLLDETRERVNVGTSAPIDMVQSEAGVATRLQDLIVSKNAAANAEDTLKRSLGFDSPAEWLLNIDATESYEIDSLDVNLAEAIETALEHRPIIRQRLIALETNELYVKLARNAVLPNLDLDASYGFSGVGGDLHIRDPETGDLVEVIPGGPGDAVNQIGDYPHWRLGVVLSLPFGNNEAKGRLAQRRYELDRAKVDLAALKQQIIHEVRIAVRTLHDGAAAIDAAVASTELARRNLEAEYTKFNNGLSTNYQVLMIQEDMAEAQLRELNTRIIYRKAIAAYYSTTGTLLNRLNVKIVDPGAPESPHTLWEDVEWMQFVDLAEARNKVTAPAKPYVPAG